MWHILKKRNTYRVFVGENVNERDRVEDLGMGGRILQ